MRSFVLLGALALALLPVRAVAFSSNGQAMMGRWAQSDKCAASARRQFPDYTPEANAKRDRAMQQCLASNFDPPKGDLQH